MDPLTPGDLLFIASNKFPSLAASAPAPATVTRPSAAAAKVDAGGGPTDGDQEASLLSRMIAFNRQAPRLHSCLDTFCYWLFCMPAFGQMGSTSIDALLVRNRGQHNRLPPLAIPHGSDASKSSKNNTSTFALSLACRRGMSDCRVGLESLKMIGWLWNCPSFFFKHAPSTLEIVPGASAAISDIYPCLSCLAFVALGLLLSIFLDKYCFRVNFDAICSSNPRRVLLKDYWVLGPRDNLWRHAVRVDWLDANVPYEPLRSYPTVRVDSETMCL